MTVTVLRRGYPKTHHCALPKRWSLFHSIEAGTVVQCDECGLIQEWRYINNRWQWGASNFRAPTDTHNCNDHAPDTAHES